MKFVYFHLAVGVNVIERESWFSTCGGVAKSWVYDYSLWGFVDFMFNRSVGIDSCDGELGFVL